MRARDRWVNLDEIICAAFLIPLVLLGVLRDTPVFEEIRRSGIAYRTLQTFFVGSLIAMLFFRARLGRLVRLWLPLVLALMTYEGLKHMHATALTYALGIGPKDGLMRAFDDWLFGPDTIPSLAAAVGARPALSALLFGFYALYYFLPALTLANFHAPESEAIFRRVRRGLVLCLFGGYLMYVLIPVAGPEVDGRSMAEQALRFSDFYRSAYETLRFQFDCFPSLHTAMPWTLVLLSWPHLSRALRTALAIAAAGSTAAAVGLGYHYGADILAGLVWAVVVVLLARWSTPAP